MAKKPIDIRSLARSYTEMAIQTLAGIVQNGSQESAKVSAAKELLDRGWGKAEVKAEIHHIKYVADVPAVSETVEQWEQQHRLQ